MSSSESIWNVVKTKVAKLQGANMLLIKRPKMFQNLLPAIASVDSELIDMDMKNIDGISLLGRVLQSEDYIYITFTDVTAPNPSTIVEAAAMGQLLCGLKDEQWKELVTTIVPPAA